MKYFVALALVCAALVGELARADPLGSQEWMLFKQQFGKSYESPEEDARRLANFVASKARIEAHNANGNSSFRMGLNHMSDWTQEELAQLRGARLTDEILKRIQDQMPESEAYTAQTLSAGSSNQVPDEFDWRTVPGRVTSVKSQGVCGACWAFAAVAVLDGQQMTQLGAEPSQVIDLSEQELVDCSTSNGGCGGGWMSDAFDDLNKLGGIVARSNYPYTEQQDTCTFDQSQVVMRVGGGYTLRARDEAMLKEMVYRYGPISVTLDAPDSFHNYQSGFYVESCSSDPYDLDHAIVLVGYGTDPNYGDYWIAKNSWGTWWGEDGYVKMLRGINQCGIANFPQIATF